MHQLASWRSSPPRQTSSIQLQSKLIAEFSSLDSDFLMFFRSFLSWVVIFSLVGAVTAQDRLPEKGTSTLKPATEPRVQAEGALESPSGNAMREMQSESMRTQKPIYGHWGNQPNKFSSWTNHSNRLIPVYTFGITLDSWRQQGSVYADKGRLRKLYGSVPAGTYQPTARYDDQTDLYQLQIDAYEAGYQNIIVFVFDGMDWQTTRAAAIYKRGRDAYQSGRGAGLAFQDERRTDTDFGLVCTSAYSNGAKTDVNSQTILRGEDVSTGGFDLDRGGRAPWYETPGRDYLLGRDREQRHTVTDSAASATSICSGIKTYNGAINVTPDGKHVVPIARRFQEEHELMVGVVTSVPISHATPAAAYANNVSRKDYQDLSRDLLGLPSISHRADPLLGVDVLIGCGIGEGKKKDASQGENFASGNVYLHEADLRQVDVVNGGKYVVAKRTKGKSGNEVLQQAAELAAGQQQRLLGFFGGRGGHLPFQTANGHYDPTFDVKGNEKYSKEDVLENPTLAEMTTAALTVLEQGIDGFWLMIEAGDVDWANHANNLDNSIGAVLSGEEAFLRVMDWIKENHAWDVTAVIVTSDHGHYLVIDDSEKLAKAGKQ